MTTTDMIDDQRSTNATIRETCILPDVNVCRTSRPRAPIIIDVHVYIININFIQLYYFQTLTD